MKKFLFSIAAGVLSVGTFAIAASVAGTSADPLISRSYAEGTYAQAIVEKAETAAKQVLQDANTQLNNRLTEIENQYSDSGIRQMVEQEVVAALGTVQAETVSVSAGTIVKGSLGMQLCVVSGQGEVKAGSLVNITAGRDTAAGEKLTVGQLYLADIDGASVQFSTSATVKITGKYQTETAQLPDGGQYTAKYVRYADALKIMGLFSGTDLGYELERVPTRAEGLVMLLRLLGEEQAASKYTGKHPFRDVPDWAEKYIAYAYEKGYTSGVSSTLFGSQNALSTNDYLTFLLRALGYRDSEGDFSWDTASQMAVRCGILTQAEADTLLSRGTFYRDDVVYTSYQTLFCTVSSGNEKLYQQLLRQQVFTQDQLDQALVIFS